METARPTEIGPIPANPIDSARIIVVKPNLTSLRASLCLTPPTLSPARPPLFRPFLLLSLAWVTGLAHLLGAAVNPVRQVEFREPRRTTYIIDASNASSQPAGAAPSRLLARVAGGSTNLVEITSRVVLQYAPGTDLQSLLTNLQVTVDRTVDTDLVILQAPSAAAAIDVAESLAQKPGVVASYPVMRRNFRRQGAYAPLPNDPYFPRQWHLEYRNSSGQPKGPDLNIRSAWSVTRGEGVLVAVADDGIELTHPDLATATAGQPHFNFDLYTTNGLPEDSTEDHATAVSGLIAAEADNHRGVVGTAPKASMVSLVIFGSSSTGTSQIITDSGLLDMYQYASNRISVQNHSWGSGDTAVSALDALSDRGIANAVTKGRGGLGVVLSRAGGNYRDQMSNSNDDGQSNDPRQIAVAAIRSDGRVCGYSSPGANLLVAAPSGEPAADGSEDPKALNIVTTDRQGTLGYNTSGSGDSASYGYGATGFTGTSAAAPQIAGVAALILSANPHLGYRDVQQILAQSARHFDFADPALQTNAAGFRVSHNVGFGVPDAGFAVRLARHWSNRPAATQITVQSSTAVDIPPNGVRLLCTGDGLDLALASIVALPCLGAHPDAPTPILPLVYVDQVNAELTQDLHGKGALIRRGVSYFSDKLARAARAGAAFAVVFDNVTETNLILMAGTDFAPIPAVFISKSDGDALQAYVQSQTNQTGQLSIAPAVIQFKVTDTLSCEHVGVRLTTTGLPRSDQRITLVSPAGTRSVLQALNNDSNQGPVDWTYWSSQCLYEGTAGTWRLEVSNEQTASTGSVSSAQLIIQGVPLVDSDHDGLDDRWERKWFGSLAYGPSDNPAGDGFSNALKQCLDVDPTQVFSPYPTDLSFWNTQLARFSFQAVPGVKYTVHSYTNLGTPPTVITNLFGGFPTLEAFVPYAAQSTLLLQAVPASQ